MKKQDGKIIVIDDEPGMREGIRRILEHQGYFVETAQNGTEGLEKGTEQEYDLYIIDLKMPDIDGIEVLRIIKAKFPEAICVIATAYASIDTALETTRNGAYHYIAKPFSPDELNILVERALERRWYILEARRLREDQEHRLLEVAHEKSRLKTIIQALDDGILLINLDGELVLFNPRFLQLLHIEQELHVGQPILDILPEELSAQMKEFLSNGNEIKAIGQEFVIQPPDKLVIMANTTPVLNEDGKTIGVVSVLRDITELKKIDLLRAQFVDMATHELKSPLSAIQGYLEMVVEKQLGDAQETYDNYIARSLERTKSLLSLVNDLLNISRMEAGKTRREIQKLNIKEEIETCVNSLQEDIDKNGLRVIKNGFNPMYINMDAKEFQRLLNQLVSNAIKYNKENGEIIITAEKSGHYAKISIKDTGIGLQKEELSRLFEDFFRAKNEFTRRITGTGLGLTVAKKIVDAYAGEIKVESEFGKGSTFTIYLPATA